MKTQTFVIQEDADLRSQFELFWDIDTVGVKSDEPSEVHTNFMNNLVFNGARYEITLPTLPGPAFSVVRGGGGAQRPRCQK